MACDTQLLPNQTITERKDEVKEAVKKFMAALANGSAKVVVGPKGEVAFTGVNDTDRARVTDECVYRQIMSTGSALARAKIAAAEQMSGRSINRQVVGQGHHSHDGGRTWHSHKG